MPTQPDPESGTVDQAWLSLLQEMRLDHSLINNLSFARTGNRLLGLELTALLISGFVIREQDATNVRSTGLFRNASLSSSSRCSHKRQDCCRA